ncbi:stimulus-sensing domain-containing protein [Kordiimonas marina]|uniref:stimulus-sensing domain-containing protein n=1 Tax=Kordiimonas marina TaxID=2872312 RepID=UPI001FF14403|nr:stimulus-sensing domain-containing protein [Kordiimonas marina]MCJ9428305.1 sensor histidine kinase [Kordiimonas marina]
MVSVTVTETPEPVKDTPTSDRSSSSLSEGSASANQPRHYTRGLSPLMIRIMAINAIALLILVGGVLYLNQFRQNLIHARVEELTVQAEIIAGALGEAAAGGPEATEIDLAPARQIITRLVGPTDNRARLFANDGRMIADSRFLAGDKRLIEEELPRLDSEPSLRDDISETLHRFLDSISRKIDAPENVDRPGMRAEDFIEVQSALAGALSVQLRKREDGKLVINIAAPVQRFRRVLGALLLTAQTEDIDAIVRAEQMVTLKVFFGALGVTILLSFFLGRTLVRPVRVLARAAERVRRGIGREESIPEFAERLDEIGDLSRSLSDMTRALYRQIDAVEQFAADVAHEIKNPLSSMRSALDTLPLATKPEQRDKLFAILQEDVKRIDRLITDISDASRLDAELTRGEAETIDLGYMLSVLVDAYRTTQLPEGISLQFEEGVPGVYMVRGIEARLGQVWRNFIDNAVSFSPDGGTVSVTLAIREGFVVLAVEDDGPGLPEGSEEKVFRRFYSERPETEAFGGHSGLGLAISKQVIEAHGGWIMAENRLDEDGNVLGARFMTGLPVAAED